MKNTFWAILFMNQLYNIIIIVVITLLRGPERDQVVQFTYIDSLIPRCGAAEADQLINVSV